MINKKRIMTMLLMVLLIGLTACSSGTKAGQLGEAYRDLTIFSQGLVAAKDDNNLWGYVNLKGEVVISFTYDDAKPFNAYGIAEVTKDGLQGFIDPDGQIVLPIEYTLKSLPTAYGGKNVFMHDGTYYFIVKEDNQYKVIDKDGNIAIGGDVYAIDCSNYETADWCLVKDSNGIGSYRNLSGDTLQDGDVVGITAFNADGIAVAVHTDTNKQYFIGTDGQDLYGLSYDRAYTAQEGSDLLEVANFGDTLALNYGVINRQGDVLIDPDTNPQDQMDFNTDFSVVISHTESRTFAIDMDGNVLLDSNDGYTINNWYDTGIGRFAVFEKDGQYGVMDDTGAIVLELQPYQVIWYEEGDVIGFDEASQRSYLVSIDGENLLGPVNGLIVGTIDATNLYFARSGKNPYHLYNSAGKWLNEDLQIYDLKGSGDILFSNGLMKVAIDLTAKYGYIDTTGKIVIQPAYDKMTGCGIFGKDGYALEYLDGYYGIINYKGKTVVPFEYKAIRIGIG